MPRPPNTIPDLFEAQAAATPDAIAVSFEDRILTYRQLDARANRLAHRLIRAGITRGGFVGLSMQRGPEVIVGMLGILKAGGAYVPLDPAYPDERLAFMLGDTAAAVVLVHPPTADRMAPFAGRTEVLCLTSDADFTAESTADPACEITGEDLAYVMYTSGSTGRPKGVLVDHRPIVSLVRESDYCHFGPDEVFLHLAPLAFDASTFEIWGALLNGGRVAILPPGPPALDGLADAIARHRVTTMFLTTALFNLVVDQRVEMLRPLRQLLMGGELVSPRHVQRAVSEFQDGVLRHVYGPTECTTFATCFPVAKAHRTEDGIPIGRPIANTTAYILDEQMGRVPPGTPGEFYLGGARLARGYLNLPELTREKFVPDPFASDPRARLYRTGDRVVGRADGTVDFLGRFDDQVKIAGHRIEPGEIEVTLRQCPGVRQTAVAARPLPSGGKQLVGYVVAEPGDFSADEIKRFLGDRLPDNLVPAQIVRLDALPLTPNGKVDRAALPTPEHKPDCAAGAADLIAAPPGAEGREGELAAIWARVLGRVVGVEDNFFDLGGTSLQLLEVHALLTRALGRDVPLMALFEYPTLRALARHLFAAAEVDPAVSATQDRARRQKEALLRRRKLP